MYEHWIVRLKIVEKSTTIRNILFIFYFYKEPYSSSLFAQASAQHALIVQRYTIHMLTYSTKNNKEYTLRSCTDYTRKNGSPHTSIHHSSRPRLLLYPTPFVFIYIVYNVRNLHWDSSNQPAYCLCCSHHGKDSEKIIYYQRETKAIGTFIVQQ